METIGKYGLISTKEAIVRFIGTTSLYLAVIFIRELCSWGTEKTSNEILTIKSYKALVFIGSVLYIVFLVTWVDTVIRSYKRYKRNK